MQTEMIRMKTKFCTLVNVLFARQAVEAMHNRLH